jgi:DNA-binding YbaB/EbfC family protein
VFDKLGDMKNMMKSAMEMKQRMESLKEQLGDQRVEASAGGGMVKVVMSGKLEVLSLEIDPEIISRDEPEMLQTLVQAAVNEGIQQTQEMVKAKMQELTMGIDVPGITS